MATDLFPDAEVGQCINEEDAVIKSFVTGGAITKGYPVKFSDKSVWPPEVVAAGAGERSIGVALKAAAASGDVIPVAVDNAMVKVTIGAALACGVALKTAADGKFVAALEADHNVAVGILLQKTTAVDDTGIILVKANFLGVGV